MLRHAVLFLIAALVTGALGYFGIAGVSAGIGQVLFMVFLVLFLASLIAGDKAAPELRPAPSRYKSRDRLPADRMET